MIEWTARVIFITAALGDQKINPSGRFFFQRADNGQLLFLPTWHHANMKFAASILGRHQKAVQLILWDPAVDAALPDGSFTRQYYSRGGVQRYSLHETIFPGQTVGINFVAPPELSHDDLVRLLDTAGKYRGLSPWKPNQGGHFRVHTLTRRRESGDTYELEITQQKSDGNLMLPSPAAGSVADLPPAESVQEQCKIARKSDDFRR